MADIRLITILPPPTVPVAPTIAQGGNSNPTPKISNLSPGTLLSGFIINRDASGNPILRTETGDITFASQFFLKIGSEVNIRVEYIAGQTLAHILSVDGQTPELAEKKSAFAGEPQVIVSNALSSSTQAESEGGAKPSVNYVFSGTVVSAPPSQEAEVAPLTTQPIPLTQTTKTAAPTTLFPVGSNIAFEIVGVAAPTPLTPPPTTITANQTTANTSAPINPESYAVYARASGVSTPTSEILALAAASPVAGGALLPESIVAGTLTKPSGTAAHIATTVAPAPNAAAPVPTPNPTPALPTAEPPALPVSTPTTALAGATPSLTAAPVIVNQPSGVIPNTATTIPAAATTSVPTAPVNTPAPVFAPLIQGKVVASEAGGQTLVQTPIGALRVQLPTVLAPGSTLTLKINNILTPATLPALPNNTAALPLTPLTELAQHWPALQQIFDVLTGQSLAANPAQLLSPAFQNPALFPDSTITPHNLSAGVMVFISALRGGDFRNWLGNATSDWLENERHGELLKKASREFTMMAQQFVEPKPGQWQSLFFPVAVEGLWQQVRLFVKRDRKQDKDSQDSERKKDDTRFVVEVDLSQLGEIQMDGFVRRDQKQLNFDLVIRSLHPLSDEVQKDILTIYTSTAEITGFRGSLSFKQVREFPVNPMEDIVAVADKVTV